MTNEEAKSVQIGDGVITKNAFGNLEWLVIDLHYINYPNKVFDLRRTIVRNPKKRYLDSYECRLRVDASLIHSKT